MARRIDFVGMEKKILIVEDSQVLARAYSLPFLRKGYRVEMTADGRQALQLIRSFQPDVLLLDLVLPKVRGSVLLEAIRSSPEVENLPVIVFTNSLLLPGEEVRIRKLADRFVNKAQTSPEQIIHVVEELLTPVAAKVPETAQALESNLPAVEQQTLLATSAVQTPPPAAAISMPVEPAEETKAAPAPEEAAEVEAFPQTESPIAPVAPPGTEAGPRVPENPASLLHEIETHTRRLLTEQNEDAQGTWLTKIEERLRSLDEVLPRDASGDLGLLLKVFDALVANLSQNRKHRTSSAFRTLLQACPILQRLSRHAQSAGLRREPPLTKTLAVDDSVVSLKAVARALETIPLQCDAVTNPLEAIDLMAANAFDLVVLDVDMPQMAGPDLCKKLRSLPQHTKTPVIFLTSLNRFDIRVTTARSGGDDFMTKPFLAPELALKALTHIFRRRLDAAQT